MNLTTSLRARFILLSLLLVVLLVGGFSIYAYNSTQSKHISNWQSQQLDQASHIADQIAPHLRASTPCTELQILTDHLSRILQNHLVIILPNGRVCAESATKELNGENLITQNAIQNTLNGDETSTIHFDNQLQENVSFFAVPIQSDNEIIGALFMIVSNSQLYTEMRTTWYSVISTLILCSIIFIILALLVNTMVFKPVHNLTNEIQGMDYITTRKVITPYRVNEVEQLRLVFNNLVTRQNQQIEDLKGERGKLDAVLSSMTDGVMIVDSDGIIQLINPAAREIFGVNKPATGEQTLIEVIRHHQVIDVWRLCRENNTQETTTLETFPDRLFVQVIAIPFHQVIPGNTLLLFQDLTHVRRLETVRRDFVSNVSHELRTPLASLKALIETLTDGALKDPPVAQRFLQRMDTEIDNLTQLVEELLELTRIESGRVPLEKKEVSPQDVVDSAVERMQTQAERAGLNLYTDVPSNLAVVHADPKRIQQLFINLLHNAIKFTPPGGEIHVSAYEDGDNITFSIRDTGTGIPEQYLGRIFERFYKADRARSGGGTGLGLSIARHLVQAHDGKIWAVNNPDKGSTFFFTLPKA